MMKSRRTRTVPGAMKTAATSRTTSSGSRKGPVTSREERLQAAIAETRKAHGEDAIVWGKDIARELVPRCTSGALSLDVALGGGWPMNQWVEVIGPESSGKSLAIAKTIAANQARDKEWTALW